MALILITGHGASRTTHTPRRARSSGGSQKPQTAAAKAPDSLGAQITSIQWLLRCQPNHGPSANIYPDGSAAATTRTRPGPSSLGSGEPIPCAPASTVARFPLAYGTALRPGIVQSMHFFAHVLGQTYYRSPDPIVFFSHEGMLDSGKWPKLPGLPDLDWRQRQLKLTPAQEHQNRDTRDITDPAAGSGPAPASGVPP